MAIVLATIACSSAPAVIVGLLHEGKARGPVTTTTLGVLALTNALAVVANRAGDVDAFIIVEEMGDLLFTAFFVLNGLLFDLSGMKNAGVLTIFVILSRWSGKYLGARIGARIARAPLAIEKYPGLVLLPKAGLTLGLAFMARDLFPSFGVLMFDALLAPTMINMLITPPLARSALIKAQEANF